MSTAVKPPLPPARPGLSFASVDDAIADVKRLRACGDRCRRAGTWTLAQAAWHMSVPIRRFMSPPAAGVESPTPAETAAKANLFATLAKRSVQQLDAPAFMQPPADAGDADIDQFIEQLEQLKAYPHALVAMGNYGPTPIAEFRDFVLAHTAHHLAYFAPAAERRAGLRYETIDDAIADVRRLCNGYTQAGNWTLEQVCWHLNIATRARMKPGPYEPNTPEQAARAPVFAKVLAEGQLPSGLVAPDTMVPPTDADSSAVAQFVDALEQLKSFPGPFAPHRLFGHMSDADSRRQILIHAAHHLSHLMPNDTNPAPRQGLKYDSVGDVIDDVQRLRRGHRQVGKWTLAQTAWHVGMPLSMCMRPVPDDAVSSPEQQAMKARLDMLLTMDAMPSGQPMPPGVDPMSDAPSTIDDSELDRLVDLLRQLESFTQARVNFGPFGIVSNDEFRRFNLMHAANHLRHFIPTTN